MKLVFSITLISIGSFFILTSIVGMIRFPSFFAKMHASSITDSLGMPLCLFGICLLHTNSFAILKILFIIFIVYAIYPTNTHILAKAASISDDAELIAKIANAKNQLRNNEYHNKRKLL